MSVCVCVCVSVTIRNTLFRRLWRPLVEGCIANIGIQWHNFWLPLANFFSPHPTPPKKNPPNLFKTLKINPSPLFFGRFPLKNFLDPPSIFFGGDPLPKNFFFMRIPPKNFFDPPTIFLGGERLPHPNFFRDPPLKIWWPTQTIFLLPIKTMAESPKKKNYSTVQYKFLNRTKQTICTTKKSKTIWKNQCYQNFKFTLIFT